MVVLGECFRAHEDAGGFFAKDDERPFADPLFTPPSSPSYQQHPTPSSTAVDSPPHVVSLSTPASEQSTPTYTGMHLPLDPDEVKTSDASKHDGEVRGLNSDEDEDADAEGEDDDGEWVPAIQGGQLPSWTPQDDILQPTLPPSSSSTTAESAFIATLSETSSTQPVIDDASNAQHHHSNAEHTARANCADLSVSSTAAENDNSERAIQSAVAGHGVADVADVADASLNTLNTAYVLNADTHGEEQNAGSVAPFDNFGIFLSDLPANPDVWTTTQPERHIDVSPALSTSLRSPYSFTEEKLPFGAYDASSTVPFLGAQRGSGQTVFGSRYESHQQLWDDMHAHQVFLSSGMQTTHGEFDDATSAGLFLPTEPLHYRRAPLELLSYIAPPSVHTRSAAPAGNVVQSSRNAQTNPIFIPWVSSSQFPTPTQFAKGKGKAIASHNEQGPSDHPRPVAKLPSRSRNRTQASSRRTQAAAANVPPHDFHRQWVHYELGQIQASAGPSRLPTHSSNTHASIAIASTSRSATAAPTPHDPSSFASTSQPARSFAPSTTPAPPTQQDYMSKFRVDLDERLPAPCFMHPETGELQIFVRDCGWVGPNGEVCRHDYQQNVWGNGDMRKAVYAHLLVHKRTPLANVYHPVENLRLGPHGKSGSKKARGSKEAPNPDRDRCEKGEKDKGDERSQQEGQELNSSQARGKKLKCCLRDPKTGIFCGREFTYGEISGHVCRIHYDMPEWRKRGCSSDADADDRPTKKART